MNETNLINPRYWNCIIGPADNIAMRLHDYQDEEGLRTTDLQNFLTRNDLADQILHLIFD